VLAPGPGGCEGNPRTVGDPAWQPFLNTPNYPDYTSGFDNVVGAMTRALPLFFGTDRFIFTAEAKEKREFSGHNIPPRTVVRAGEDKICCGAGRREASWTVHPRKNQIHPPFSQENISKPVA
jgi:hypothetical protein